MEISSETFTKYLEDYRMSKFKIEKILDKKTNIKEDVVVYISYIDALTDVLESGVFPEVSFHNVRQYLNPATLKKLEVEYGTKGYFKKEHRIKENSLW